MIPGQGTRSCMLKLRVHMPQVKILRVTTKTHRRWGGGKEGYQSGMRGAGRPVWMVSSEVAEKAGSALQKTSWALDFILNIKGMLLGATASQETKGKWKIRSARKYTVSIEYAESS